MRYFIFILILFFMALNGLSQEKLSYQMPPTAIADMVNAPQTPYVSVNTTGDWMLLLERPGYPSIEELAQPELRLGGLRINPRTNGSSRATSYTGMIIQSVAGEQKYPVRGLPDNPHIQNVNWSPDGQKIAFTIEKSGGIELWIAELETGMAHQLTEPILNDAMGGTPYDWFSDSRTLLYKAVPSDRGEIPKKPLTPEGPVIQVSTGEKAPVRTYQDLLENAHDEALFDFYASSELILLDTEMGTSQSFGSPGVINQVAISPDDRYVLVSYIRKPYSYIVPYYRFAQQVMILDRQGQPVSTIADLPPAENIPQGFGAVATGPRSFTWRNDVPATIYWVEAQDGGDPSREVPFRDKMFYLEAPFNGEKQEGIDLKLRFGDVTWGNDQLAVVEEWWWTTREEIISSFHPKDGDSRKVLFERSFEDRYSDPGNFQTTVNIYGKEVLLTGRSGNILYLTGQGASPEGNRPFLREYDINKVTTRELWRSEAPYYEYPVSIIDLKKGLLLTRKESREDPPNYFLRNYKKDDLRPLTTFPNPYPQLTGIEKQVINYKRSDGISLKGDLYLPRDFQPGNGTLPVILWAYPDEFKSADHASQVTGSPYEFIRLYWGSPLYFLTQGYAVLDDPGMPVVGEGEQEPNDTFRKQLVMNAEAAIDRLVEMGIADRNRIAIGGHSYGAFMTANLLAHSDLFAGGIARSGAYNRTLTPFGFQAEERTYWDAPEIYYNMSPFMHADKINEPILLIHGAADNNSGTFPIQSERMFAAIKGLGGRARLVMLPHESHGYRAGESILHMFWEMHRFLEKYVKNAE